MGGSTVMHCSARCTYDARTFFIAVDPTRISLHEPRPGDFFGNSTIPDSCSGDPTLICNDLSINPLTDGEYGDTSNGVDSSQFIAWSESSRFTLTRAGGIDTLGSVRTINLFFYHDPALGVGLPELTIAASISEVEPEDSLQYDIIGNQDLAAGDAQVRNVTIALSSNIAGDANRIHIAFSLTNGVQQFALSEVELCSDTGRTSYHSHALILIISISSHH